MLIYNSVWVASVGFSNLLKFILMVTRVYIRFFFFISHCVWNILSNILFIVHHFVHQRYLTFGLLRSELTIEKLHRSFGWTLRIPNTFSANLSCEWFQAFRKVEIRTTAATFSYNHGWHTHPIYLSFACIKPNQRNTEIKTNTHKSITDMFESEQNQLTYIYLKILSWLFAFSLSRFVVFILVVVVPIVFVQKIMWMCKLMFCLFILHIVQHNRCMLYADGYYSFVDIYCI